MAVFSLQQEKWEDPQPGISGGCLMDLPLDRQTPGNRDCCPPETASGHMVEPAVMLGAMERSTAAPLVISEESWASGHPGTPTT